jgi:hypothetical protein
MLGNIWSQLKHDGPMFVRRVQNIARKYDVGSGAELPLEQGRAAALPWFLIKKTTYIYVGIFLCVYSFCYFCLVKQTLWLHKNSDLDV